MSSILVELNKRIEEHPNKLLYAFLNIKGEIIESYTYKEFEIRSKNIAGFIQNNYNFKSGDRILLAHPPGLEMICSFFACVHLGLIPVPVYPPSANGFESSVRKMKSIGMDCDASAILTTRSYYLSTQINLGRLISTNSREYDYFQNTVWIATDEIGIDNQNFLECPLSEILFLQYTSGSTSEPKGVIITHNNLLDNCNNVVDHTPVGVSWLPQYHDMGLIGYYLFFALKGGTTYGFSPTDFILKPSLWLETITKYKGTATSAPNFAFDYCLQEGKISEEILESIDLSSLRFVMNAAEPIKPSVYNAFIQKFQSNGLNPEVSFTAYGLAENTLAVTNYGRTIKSFVGEGLKNKEAIELSANERKEGVELISCGNTLGDTVVKIVSTENVFNELAHGQVGEIWVTGSSKGLGYWNNPEKTKETFNAVLEDDSRSWLRTGDLGFVLNNELYVCGRIKDMIIIRGQNFYPQDVESLFEEDPSVRKGCVSAFSIETDEGQQLIVVAGVKNRKEIIDFETINKRSINLLGISIDTAITVLARDVAKTSSGKIRRMENKRLFLSSEFEVLQAFNSTTNDTKELTTRLNSNPQIDALFNQYGLTGNETSTLGDSGLDSMKLAEFAHDLKGLIIQLGFDDLVDEVDLRILQKIAASELYDILFDLSISSRLARYKFKRSLARINSEYIEIEKKMMHRDSSAEILNSFVESHNHSNTQNKIFLTGGTGFFGPFLIKSLLEQQQDDIIVLVRSINKTDGLNRLRQTFSIIQCGDKLMQEFESRVSVICGSLDRHQLGLNSEDWDFLSNHVHTIYHNGAMVNYLLDYESMRGSNVNGTNEIIRLAGTKRKKILNYISTTFIFGWSTKDVLYETDCNDEMALLDFGYSQSKWVSEKLVENAQKNGLPVRIFRPALISPSIDGMGYNFDISIRLMAFMVKYGIGTTAKNQVSFTPADIGANNIVAISMIAESINHTFHVTRDEFSSMKDVTKILGELVHKEFKYYRLKDFVPQVINRCKKDDLLFPLLNFLVRSVDNISSMEFKRYDNSNYQKFRNLSPFGKEDHSLYDLVKGIYKFMVNNNLIESEKVSHEK
jgi:thioester reductase-like protein